ncbi:MAG: septum site-determining protein MinC [Granulosicoccus sp.]
MSSNPGVEFKGGMYTFMSLKLHTSDTDIIDQKLADKVQQAPAFFKDTPVVIDLSVLEQLSEGELDASALLECVKRHKLIPIVASIGNKSSQLAQSIALPLIEASTRNSAPVKDPAKDADNGSDEATKRQKNADDSEPGNGQKTDDTAADIELAVSREVEYVVKAPTLVDKPVRSGQQIYARDTDLIIMGQVGPGAEVIADNNIHIYGPLRGRALCGVSGNTSTRIFCSSLEAELVSVAGNFRMLETIPEELRGKPAQIWLDKDRLNIEPL